MTAEQNTIGKNPILYFDCSDPDVIRVGDTYYMTSSTFCMVPGLPVYASKNLVNWQLLCYALPRLIPDSHYRQHRSGCGVWAPSIRYFEGKFSIWYPDPDFGIFKIEAEQPEGPWSPPQLVDAAVGSIDPCPFIDEDGSRWLVKAWAKSRVGFNNRITLHSLDKHFCVQDSGLTIIDGETLATAKTSLGDIPWRTIEGPKLYKRGKWYYIFLPAGGVKQGWQAVFRAPTLQGPWEERVVMDQGSSDVNGPHQGAWIDAEDGRHWFIHFQDRDAWGRIVHVQPLQWIDDWPIIGETIGSEQRGQPVAQFAAPGPLPTANAAPLLHWQWHANPDTAWGEPRPDGYHLCCVSGPQNPWENSAMLSLPIQGPTFTLQTRLEFSAKQDGERAGICLHGYACRWLGLQRKGNTYQLILEDWPEAETARNLFRHIAILEHAPASIWLRMKITDSAYDNGNRTMAQFFWSFNKKNWQEAGEALQVQPGRWIGARAAIQAVALYGTLSSTAGQNGWADFCSLKSK